MKTRVLRVPPPKQASKGKPLNWRLPAIGGGALVAMAALVFGMPGNAVHDGPSPVKAPTAKAGAPKPVSRPASSSLAQAPTLALAQSISASNGERQPALASTPVTPVAVATATASQASMPSAAAAVTAAHVPEAKERAVPIKEAPPIPQKRKPIKKQPAPKASSAVVRLAVPHSERAIALPPAVAHEQVSRELPPPPGSVPRLDVPKAAPIESAYVPVREASNPGVINKPAAPASAEIQDPKVLTVAGSQVYVRVNPRQTLVVQVGGALPGLGTLKKIDKQGAQFEKQFVPHQ